MSNKPIYKNTAFVIMPSGSKGEYDGGPLSSEEIFNQIIHPAIKHADEKLQPDLEILNMKSANIPVSIIEKLNYAKVVVADLTKANPNVTFELGVRWRSRCKGTVLISQEPGENPFDIAHFRSLKYDPHDVELSIKNVSEAITQTLDSEEPDSGVFDALPELPRVTLATEEFWKPFLLSPVHVIIGSIPVKVEGEDRWVADFVAESIHSASEIVKQLHILNQFEVSVLTQRVDEQRILDSLKDNLVFIGTRHSHPIGGQELKRPNFRLDFEYDSERLVNLLYRNGEASEYHLGENEVYGTIQKIPSPFDKRKHIVVLAGNNRYATLAAARGVCGESPELIERVGGQDCEVLFKARLIGHQLGYQPMPITIEEVILLE